MKTLFQIQQERNWALVYAMVSLFISLLIFFYLFLKFGKDFLFTEKYWVAGLYAISILLFSHAIEWFIRWYYWIIKIRFHFGSGLFLISLVLLWEMMEMNNYYVFLSIFPLLVGILNLIGCKLPKTPQEFDLDLAKKYLEDNYPCSVSNEVFELCYGGNSWYFVWNTKVHLNNLYFTRISVVGEEKQVYKCKRKFRKLILPARIQNLKIIT